MGEKTLRIGTGVDDLVVSRAGLLALRLNPQDWHREANVTEDISVRLRARPSIATVFDEFTLPSLGQCAKGLKVVWHIEQRQ